MDIAKDIVITADNLASIKFWIMQEMQKLETERDEFETEQIEFEIEKDEFRAEKKKYEEERRKASELLKKREQSADLERKSLNYQKTLWSASLRSLKTDLTSLTGTSRCSSGKKKSSML